MHMQTTSGIRSAGKAPPLRHDWSGMHRADRTLSPLQPLDAGLLSVRACVCVCVRECVNALLRLPEFICLVSCRATPFSNFLLYSCYRITSFFASPSLLCLFLSTQTNKDEVSPLVNLQHEQSYECYTCDHTGRSALCSPHVGLGCFNRCGSEARTHTHTACASSFSFVLVIVHLLVQKCWNTNICTPKQCGWLLVVLKLGVSCHLRVRSQRSKVSTCLTFLFVAVNKLHSHIHTCMCIHTHTQILNCIHTRRMCEYGALS